MDQGRGRGDGRRGGRSGPSGPAPPPTGASWADAERRRFASLFERAPIGLITVDRVGSVVEVNQRALRLLQAGPPSVLGRPLQEHVARESHGLLAAHLHAVFHGTSPCKAEIVFERRSDGSRFVAQLESEQLTDEHGRRTCLTAISDATVHRREELERSDRARREEALKQESQAIQRRFDQIAVASAQLGEDLDLGAAVSRAADIAVLSVASYAAVDLVDADGRVRRAAFAHADGGKEDLPLDPHAPSGSAMVVRTGRSVVAYSVTGGDLLGLTDDPAALRVLRERVASYLCVPLRAHGRTLGAMSFARAGAPRFTQDDLVLAAELARHAALAIDNARLYREAQETDQRKDEFLAMLGHELRNPLAAVMMAAETLRRRPGADREALRLSEVIARQSGRLVRLVDDLLDVSRITRGKIVLRRERVVLQDIVARAVESVRPLIQSRSHDLWVVQPEELVVLDADATRLDQVLVNLLANAAKYTEPGGRIDLEVRRTGREVVIRVADTGIGIAKEALPLIFAPFTQINASPDRADRGLGIGLTLARNLVELHAGRIEAHSAGLGAGSELVVRLPIAEDQAMAAPGPSANGAAAIARRRRVLVAEDNLDLAQLLGEQLEALGQEVRITNDGIEAVDTALDFRPDLLLIDIGLPGLSGYEVAERLRKEPSLAGATLIAVTGYGGAETTSRCLAAGFDHHFTKPIREDALQGLFGGS